MRRYLLSRTENRYLASELLDNTYRSVFKVTGSEACKAAIRLFGITTEIQESFFNETFAPHLYYVEAP